MIVFRFIACLLVLAVSVPASAQFDSWGSDDWYEEEGSGYSSADGPAVRRQLSEVGGLLEAGLAALELDNWASAQDECIAAFRAASRGEYIYEDALVEGRNIAGKCVGDASYGLGNKEMACDWWAVAAYDSFVWNDPAAICRDE